MITVLKFSASWCAPCKMLSQALEEKDNIQEIDIEQNDDLVKRYNIRNVPTLVFLKNNVEVHRTTGVISPKTFDDIVNEINDEKDIDYKKALAIEVVNEIIEKGEK